jgi:hypothetical protein
VVNVCDEADWVKAQAKARMAAARNKLVAKCFMANRELREAVEVPSEET